MESITYIHLGIYMLPDLEARKRHTKYVIEMADLFLGHFSDENPIKGFIMILLHWIATGIPLLILLIGEVDTYFYISAAMFASIFAAHFYFKGCICTRIERAMLDNKRWWGPWQFGFEWLQIAGIEMTGNLADNIFTCCGIALGTIVFLRVLYSMKDN